ncbi:Neurotrypsin, partial [Halocaridina rubra]
VLVDGLLMYICDDGFGFSEADAVCRELGYNGAERFTKNNFYGSNTPEFRRTAPNFLSARLNCTDLSNINYRDCPESVPAHDCVATERAGVECRQSQSQCQESEFLCRDSVTCIPREDVCDGISQCPDNSDDSEELCTDVSVTRVVSNREINIPGAIVGSVQVKYNEEWGVMCDDRAETNEAKVICRSMGYGGSWAVAFQGSYLGEANGKMIVDTPRCTGNEDWLGECPNIDWGTSDCPEEREDLGVFCLSEDIAIRLNTDGPRHSGRVEMMINGVQGSVCDSGFDIFDAKVICRMLGYTGDAIAHRGAGRGTGPVFNLQLDCLGLEKNLQDCRVRFAGKACPSSNTAGVTCSMSSTNEAQLQTLLGNTECGIPEDSSAQFLTRLAKVRGGLPPPRFGTPWLIALRTRREAGGELLCGGVIISEDFVLTAAHCVNVFGRLNIVIRVGDYNSDFNEDYEEDFYIDKIWTHEYEDENAFNDNDIALIKIERKNGRGIRFGPRVRPVCLPSIDDDYNTLSRCTVAGWGPKFFLDDPESRLNEAGTDIISDYICEGSGGGPANYTSSMVCVGRPRVNPCRGDSGGPLVCPVEGRHTVYGLVSSGRPCSFSTSSDTFTRVTKFLDWILEKVKSSLILRQ